MKKQRKGIEGILLLSGAAILFIMLLLFLRAHSGDDLVMGAEVLNNEQLAALCESRLGIFPTDGFGSVLFNGEPIPYDEARECYYVPQNPREEGWEGKLAATGFAGMCFASDAYWEDKSSAIRDAHLFSLYLYNESEYVNCNVVFCGTSMLVLRSAQEPGTDYMGADFYLWDMEERTQGGRHETVQIPVRMKHSASGETYTVKLSKENENAMLLGMVGGRTWKIYQINEDDDTCIRSMLALKIWNVLGELDELNRPAVYTEVFVNDKCIGLCLLEPKQDMAFFEANGAYRTVEASEEMPEEAAHKPLLQDCSNLADYALFLQLSYAKKNVGEDWAIVRERGGGHSFLMPGRIEYAFGLFSDRDRYLSWHFEERVMSDEELGAAGSVVDAAARRWHVVREEALSLEKLCEYIEEEERDLIDGGAAARYMRSKGVDIDERVAAYEGAVEKLTSNLKSRYSRINDYYDAVLNSDAKALSDAENEPEIALLLPAVSDGAPRQRINLYMNEKEAYFFLPSYFHEECAAILYDETACTIKMDGEIIRNGEEFLLSESEIENIRKLSIRSSKDGMGGDYVFHVVYLENLPAIFLETANGTTEWIDENKENREPGSYLCVTEDGRIDGQAGMTIHARGRTTFNVAQKSYKLVLDAPQLVLGVDADTKWVLQANAFDTTRLRNRLCYRFAKELGLQYAIDGMPVDVWCNGEYYGNYLLCESVEVGENRVNIERKQGSYLLSIDAVSDEENTFTDANGATWELQWPKENNRSEMAAAKGLVETVNRLVDELEEDDDLEELERYIDMDSFAVMYLLDGITDEVDSNWLSTWYYYDGEKKKLFAGPAWDFDRTFGNESGYRQEYSEINGFLNGWPERLAESNQFRMLALRKLKERDWQTLMQTWVDDWAKEIRTSVEATQIRYGTEVPLSFIHSAEDIDADILYLKEQIALRCQLFCAILEHREDYCRVTVTGDPIAAGGEISGFSVWVKKGKDGGAMLSQEEIDRICRVRRCAGLMSENGEMIEGGYPLKEDLMLYISVAAEMEQAEEMGELLPDENEQQDEMVLKNLEKEEENTMSVLGCLLLFAPGCLVLLIAGEHHSKERKRTSLLLMEYVGADFMVILFTYVSLLLIKGKGMALNIATGGGYESDEFYSLQSVYVVVSMMTLELLGSCILALMIRGWRKRFSERNDHAV